MKTAHIKKTRVRLQQRMQEVMKCDWTRFGNCLEHFLAQLETDTALANVLRAVEAGRPPDQEAYVATLFQHGVVLADPVDPLIRASLFLELCRKVTERGVNRSLSLMSCTSPHDRNHSSVVASFKEQVFLPLYHYLDEQLDDGDYLLALLLHYKRYVEWFAHEDLVIKMERKLGSFQARDWDEALLDHHLRRFLMEQGVDYPFSRPKTREGEVDIVIPQGGKCLPLEVKVYDGDSRTQAHLRAGFHQATQYAEDYQSAYGYYVIFNVSTRPLTFGTDSADGFARLSDRNHDVFCICVQVTDLGPPSKRKELKSVQITEADLIEQTGATQS